MKKIFVFIFGGLISLNLSAAECKGSISSFGGGELINKTKKGSNLTATKHQSRDD